MLKKGSNWLLFILLIFIVSSTLIYNYKMKEKVTLARKNIALLGLERDLLLDNSMLQYSYNETNLNDIKMYNDENKELMLSDLLGDEFKIVFKFSYLHCLSCVSSVIDQLNDIAKEIPKDKILVIGEYDNRRAFEAFKKGHTILFPIYYVDTTKDNNNILKDENMPYVCLLNKRMEMRHLLIPMKEIPIHFKRYLNIMAKRYLKNSKNGK